jgi:hypothetical protein
MNVPLEFKLVALAVLLAACDGTVYERFWPDHTYCTVGDGVTNQGQNLPSFYMGDGQPQGENYAELAAQMHLQTFPERQDVPMTAVGLPPHTQIDGSATASLHPIGSNYGVVQVTPVEALSDRWYLMGVMALPKGVEWWAGTRLYSAPDGFVGVRFRVGSQPAVTAVSRADYPGKGTTVKVSFSENVSAATADQPWIEVRSLTDPALPSTPCTAPRRITPADYVSATCEALPADHVLEVKLRAFVSADSAISVGEAAYQLRPESLISLPDGGTHVTYIEPLTN